MKTEINLIPWRLLKQKKNNRLIIILFFSIIFLLVLCSLSLHYWLINQSLYISKTFNKKELINLSNQIKNYRHLEQNYKHQKTNQLTSIEIYNTINLIEKLMPTQVWLTKLQMSKDNWSLNGLAENNMLVTQFYNTLKSATEIKSLILNNTKSLQNKLTRFSLSFKTNVS